MTDEEQRADTLAAALAARRFGERGARYAVVPASVLEDDNLTPGLIVTLLALSCWTDADGLCWPKQATIAKRMHTTQPRVSANLARLEELGYIERLEMKADDGRRLSTYYRVKYAAAPNPRIPSGYMGIYRDGVSERTHSEQASLSLRSPEVSASAVEEAWGHYVALLQPRAILRPKVREAIRKVLDDKWSPEQVRIAMEHFNAAHWWTVHARPKWLAPEWFFKTERVSRLYYLDPAKDTRATCTEQACKRQPERVYRTRDVHFTPTEA